MGTALLHSGVVINGREYAYGGHGKKGHSGVYWTPPGRLPPGGTFRCAILHGYTFATPAEIEAVIRDVSGEFMGPSYNLLRRNCNHFTSHLCHMLTGRTGPAWLNRAASIGVALPCVVPREWIEPPAYDTADGELVDDDDDDGNDAVADERAQMLRMSELRTAVEGSDGGDKGKAKAAKHDSRSEWAP
jgi:deubiquitinase DESI2